MAKKSQNNAIKNCGLFWDRSKVAWRPRENYTNGRIRLWGKVQDKGSQFVDSEDGAVDFSRQQAVYVLHRGTKIVQAGMTSKVGTSQGLFYRLREATNDPLRSQLWDRFSWFGFRDIENGKLGEAFRGNLSHTETLSVVETVLIAAINPELNRKTGDALEVIYGQVTDPQILQNDLENSSRKPDFRFWMLGDECQKGALLEWARNRAITCTIHTASKVLYKGEEYSLSKLTAKLRRLKGNGSQVGPYWIFQDRTLDEWRDEYLAKDDDQEDES